jgi:hypothetical protein
LMFLPLCTSNYPFRVDFGFQTREERDRKTRYVTRSCAPYVTPVFNTILHHLGSAFAVYILYLAVPLLEYSKHVSLGGPGSWSLRNPRARAQNLPVQASDS